MAHRHAHERDLQNVARDAALALREHPDWEADALALRDRLDALIDEQLAASNPASSSGGVERGAFATAPTPARKEDA